MSVYKASFWGLYPTNVYMLGGIVERLGSLSFSTCPSWVPSGSSCLDDELEERGETWTVPRESLKEEGATLRLMCWRESRWCSWPKVGRSCACGRWAHGGRCWGGRVQGRSARLSFPWALSGAVASCSTTVSVMALWLRRDHCTLWILGTESWCFPICELFLILNFTFFSFIASGKINK